MPNYQHFIFKRYHFDPLSRRLALYYGYDEALEFCETYHFDFDFVSYDPVALDRALQLLFYMAGVSYYKMYLTPEIIVQTGQLDRSLAAFLGTTYQRGLGEFFYLHQLDPRTAISFPINDILLHPVKVNGIKAGQLIGLGGGKDSLVSVELLRDQPRVTTWSLNHRAQLSPLVQRIGLPHLWVDRVWDPQIQTLNQHTDPAQRALNGHVPISAIFSCVGTVVSILSGYRDTVVSNESSASEPTLHYQGVAINHQYSKSLEYESDFQACLRRLFGDSLRYYSLLRPFSELRIAELFASSGVAGGISPANVASFKGGVDTSSFAKYQDVFSSCNRAFRQGQDHLSWCGECPKCAFVFLILTPFVERSALEHLWSGKNLLLDSVSNPALESTYRQLLGIEGDKPFDCVGEVREARAAMRLALDYYRDSYPAEYATLAAQYVFELPSDYDFRAWSDHRIPEDMLAVLQHFVASGR